MIDVGGFFCTAGRVADDDDNDDEDEDAAVCEDLDFASGRVLQLRYIYELTSELRTQHVIKEILQGS